MCRGNFFQEQTQGIQQTAEFSLKEVFGYDFVKSELVLGVLRIVILAFDTENKSFVKYDDMIFNGTTMHFYKKPKRFSNL
jgi:hypothetical protein